MLGQGTVVGGTGIQLGIKKKSSQQKLKLFLLKKSPKRHIDIRMNMNITNNSDEFAFDDSSPLNMIVRKKQSNSKLLNRTADQQELNVMNLEIEKKNSKRMSNLNDDDQESLDTLANKALSSKFQHNQQQMSKSQQSMTNQNTLTPSKLNNLDEIKESQNENLNTRYLNTLRESIHIQNQLAGQQQIPNTQSTNKRKIIISKADTFVSQKVFSIPQELDNDKMQQSTKTMNNPSSLAGGSKTASKFVKFSTLNSSKIQSPKTMFYKLGLKQPSNNFQKQKDPASKDEDFPLNPYESIDQLMNLKGSRDFKISKQSHIQAKILIPKKKIIALRKASYKLGQTFKKNSTSSSPLTKNELAANRSSGYKQPLKQQFYEMNVTPSPSDLRQSKNYQKRLQIMRQSMLSQIEQGKSNSMGLSNQSNSYGIYSQDSTAIQVEIREKVNQKSRKHYSVSISDPTFLSQRRLEPVDKEKQVEQLRLLLQTQQRLRMKTNQSQNTMDNFTDDWVSYRQQSIQTTLKNLPPLGKKNGKLKKKQRDYISIQQQANGSIIINKKRNENFSLFSSIESQKMGSTSMFKPKASEEYGNNERYYKFNQHSQNYSYTKHKLNDLFEDIIPKFNKLQNTDAIEKKTQDKINSFFKKQ
ncbi:UNKNOWN [Stylonychia lemnae]|uniref:Uncharacterized protein n=1 Tax=Stylonychia lemnae TaxID=5949 RepID=A0A078ATP3_STYLE|nr:UNKNOWN [Stylonychia lemnae]|eukprot:CDW85795.1 UNKNOWN [Stylonychia lemnae]